MTSIPWKEVLIAFAGGIAKVLLLPSSVCKSKIEIFKHLFIATFTGVIVYFLLKSYNWDDDLIFALVALAGYTGAPLLNSLSNLTKRISNLELIQKQNVTNVTDNEAIVFKNDK